MTVTAGSGGAYFLSFLGSSLIIPAAQCGAVVNCFKGNQIVSSLVALGLLTGSRSFLCSDLNEKAQDSSLMRKALTYVSDIGAAYIQYGGLVYLFENPIRSFADLSYLGQIMMSDWNQANQHLELLTSEDSTKAKLAIAAVVSATIFRNYINS